MSTWPVTSAPRHVSGRVTPLHVSGRLSPPPSAGSGSDPPPDRWTPPDPSRRIRQARPLPQQAESVPTAPPPCNDAPVHAVALSTPSYRYLVRAHGHGLFRHCRGPTRRLSADLCPQFRPLAVFVARPPGLNPSLRTYRASTSPETVMLSPNHRPDSGIPFLPWQSTSPLPSSSSEQAHMVGGRIRLFPASVAR